MKHIRKIDGSIMIYSIQNEEKILNYKEAI